MQFTTNKVTRFVMTAAENSATADVDLSLRALKSVKSEWTRPLVLP